MQISTRSRYGLKIMYELALKFGQAPVFLKDIAAAHAISEKYLSKLVIPLRGVGLIASYRGAHGGYALARDPHAITVMEIVEVMEGHVASSPVRGKTPAAESHPTEEVWAVLDRAIERTLGGMTLDSLVLAGREKVLNYQI